jgi:hypothetical protein
MLGAADTGTNSAVHLGLHNPTAYRLNTQPFPSRQNPRQLGRGRTLRVLRAMLAIIRITRSRTAGSIFLGICTSS